MDLSLFGFSGLTEIYNVHPAFVHFPVALIPTALLFYLLVIAFGRTGLHTAARATLYLGTAGAAAAVITGLMGEDTFPHGKQVHEMIETHETTGFIALGLTAVLSVWSFWRKGDAPRFPVAFFAGLAVATFFILQNGDIGSRMVYLQGAAVKPVAEAMEQTHPHDHSSGHQHSH